MLDVAGQDATEAFEDVGHSDEARETLDQLLIGDLKRQVGEIWNPILAASNSHGEQAVLIPYNYRMATRSPMLPCPVQFPPRRRPAPRLASELVSTP